MNLLVHQFSLFGFTFCLAQLYNFFSFFFLFKICTIDHSCHASYDSNDYSQLIRMMPLSTCNYAQSWWVCFGAVIALFLFIFFFAFLPCCIVSFFFFFFFFTSMTALMPTRTVLQSAHFSDATEYTYNHAQSWWVSFGAEKELQRFFSFSFLFLRWGGFF